MVKLIENEGRKKMAKEKPFVLSEKILTCRDIKKNPDFMFFNKAEIVFARDVREFIKRCEEDVKEGRRKPIERYGICSYCEARFKEILKKRAGKNLSGRDNE